MNTTTPRIVLIHAVTVAIDPVCAAFAGRWPEAEVVNLLEDSLSRDRAAHADLTPDMYRRFATLTHYASDIGAHGILCTCSAFGDDIRHTPPPLSGIHENFHKNTR